MLLKLWLQRPPSKPGLRDHGPHRDKWRHDFCIHGVMHLKDQGPGITGQTFPRSCSSHTTGASPMMHPFLFLFLHIHRTSKTKKGRKAKIAQSKITGFKKKAMKTWGTNWQTCNNLRQALISNLIRPLSSMTPECVECFTSPDSTLFMFWLKAWRSTISDYHHITSWRPWAWSRLELLLFIRGSHFLASSCRKKTYTTCMATSALSLRIFNI